MFRLSLQLLLSPVLFRLSRHRLLLWLQGSHPGLQGDARDDDDGDDDDNGDDEDDNNDIDISSLTAGVSRQTLRSARS